MPLGIVSDDDFFAALINSRSSNSIPIPIPNKVLIGQVINAPTKGRGLGNLEVPEVLRKVIGESAIEDGSRETKSLTKALGISDSSLSAYKNGATSTTTYNNPDKDLKAHTNNVKDNISKRARTKLLLAINSMTAESLLGTKPRDLSSIAKDMSVVMKNMETGVNPFSQGTSGPSYLIYAPSFIKEESLNVIHLSE